MNLIYVYDLCVHVPVCVLYVHINLCCVVHIVCVVYVYILCTYAFVYRCVLMNPISSVFQVSQSC